jgi:arginine decarboxylase
MPHWTLNDSRDLYNIPHWSGGYVDINDQGHLVVRPRRDAAGASIDLSALVGEIRALGLSQPVLVRFMDILRDRVDTLCAAFAKAIEDHDYQGRYTSVYPIKVNQHESVVREILGYGAARVGLEAGSKPELMAVLALSQRDGVVVCNGYKDREYIRLALIGRELGLQVVIVVEKISELEYVIEESRNLNIKPLIGMRVRLASLGAGKWQNSGGEKSKFGLSAGQVLRMVERLRQAQMLDSLVLLHCHLGSQIANIQDIQRGMRELGRYYAELRALGAPVATVDVGGGLGIDYEGTRSRSFCSVNYSVQEYAKNVVHVLSQVCDEAQLPHPNIITESGRALTAHHAVLIMNVVDTEPMGASEEPQPVADDEAPVIQDLWQGLQSLAQQGSPVEIYHDATHSLQEAQTMYVHGVLDLAQRARAEGLYLAICQRVRALLQPGARSHREIVDELNEKLVDKYFCNFSVFQSIPDVWAIDQIFPIVPINRLDEQPTRRGVVEDITCDSDGRIDHYVDREGVEASLPLHPLRAGEDYLLGIFLVGAYQEILGDMHNLFGDTDSVNVELTADGGHRLLSPRRGDSVDYVLRYVNFDPQSFIAAFERKLTEAALSGERARQFRAELGAGLQGYTYLED